MNVVGEIYGRRNSCEQTELREQFGWFSKKIPLSNETFDKISTQRRRKNCLRFWKKMTEKKIFVNYKIVSITVIEAFG